MTIKKPKLLFLTEFFPRNQKLIFTGGVEARTYYIASLAKKDFNIKVISSSSKKIPATPISVLTRIWYAFFAFFNALGKQFDLIEGSNIVTYLPAFLAGKLKRKTTIAWIPDVLGKHWFEFGLFVGLPGFILEKISLKLPWDGVIALSHSTKKKLITAGISSKKIIVVHGGVDQKEFIGPKPKKFSQFTIICIARLVKTKRVRDLINALAKVIKTHPQASLIIVGHGPMKKSLRQLSQNLKLNSKISFQNNLPRQQLIKTLKQSHLFCLPSIVEGFGLVTIEAAAAGIPAVIADISINREVSPQEKAVLFFKPEDPQDLAVKIINMIKNKKLYHQKQIQAKKLAQSYSWQKIYAQTRNAYRHFT